MSRSRRSIRTDQVRQWLIDEATSAYREWVEQCLTVAYAYEGWSRAHGGDRGLAFEAYRAALDLEEQAGNVYGARVRRAQRELSRQARRVGPRGEGAAATRELRPAA